jgi:hypothetical protein
LRRWDHRGDDQNDGAILIAESDKDWVTLEDNVQIQFQKGGNYRSGDYWLIPARTATGDIEWPQENSIGGKAQMEEAETTTPVALPPRGIEHHYAPLAILAGLGKASPVEDAGEAKKSTKKEKSSAAQQISDCRWVFNSLSEITKEK